MIAQQPQGGLGQVSQPPQAKPAAMPQGKPAQKTDQSADADRIAAEQITAQDEPFDVNKELTNLSKGRMVLDAQIHKMQDAYAKRSQLNYDPALLAMGVAFAQPTKTGNFIESLGQGVGAYHKGNVDELTRQQELLEKQYSLSKDKQLLAQKLAGKAFLQNTLGNAPMMPSQAPTGGVPLGGLAVPSTAPNFPKISDQQIVQANLLDKATADVLKNVQTAQREQQKVEQGEFTEITVPVTREKMRVPIRVANALEAIVKQSKAENNPQLLIDFMVANNMYSPIISTVDGKQSYSKPRTAEESAAEKATLEAIAKERATASEKSGNALLDRGESALKLETLANNVLSLTDSNTRAFNLMQDATVREAVLRAIEQGANINVGSMSVGINLPVRIALQGNKEYRLTKDDITALQMFQQTQAEITAEMRKMGRTPGEGATDKTEGQLYAALGVLPSDSARALALKSEAMVQRARYDARAAQLWLKAQEEFPNKSFSSFKLDDPEYKELQKNYRQTLDDMRNKNADILRTSPKVPAPAGQSLGQSGGERKPPKGWKKMPDGSFEKE